MMSVGYKEGDPIGAPHGKKSELKSWTNNSGMGMVVDGDEGKKGKIGA